jgi:hypothetical protein
MVKSTGRLIQVLCFCIGGAFLATNAYAQNDLVDSAVAHVGLGVGINFYRPGGDADSSEGIVVAYRWHSFHSHWGPTFGLDWHTADFHQSVGPVDAPLGSIRMRALLAGFGTTQRISSRFTVSGNVFGGYSFNSLTADSGLGLAYARTGVSLAGVSVNNSAVAKPEVAIWYDFFRHVGVGVSAAYVFTRPDETITTAGGQVQHRSINGDTWEFSTGVVVGVWKKKQ